MSRNQLFAAGLTLTFCTVITSLLNGKVDGVQWEIRCIPIYFGMALLAAALVERNQKP
jgi:uncharacterized membrane protein